jgi:hypothetical protein
MTMLVEAFVIVSGAILVIVGLVSPIVILPPRLTALPLIVIDSFKILSLVIASLTILSVVTELFASLIVVTEPSAGVLSNPVAYLKYKITNI